MARHIVSMIWITFSIRAAASPSCSIAACTVFASAAARRTTSLALAGGPAGNVANGGFQFFRGGRHRNDGRACDAAGFNSLRSFGIGTSGKPCQTIGHREHRRGAFRHLLQPDADGMLEICDGRFQRLLPGVAGLALGECRLREGVAFQQDCRKCSTAFAMSPSRRGAPCRRWPDCALHLPDPAYWTSAGPMGGPPRGARKITHAHALASAATKQRIAMFPANSAKRVWVRTSFSSRERSSRTRSCTDSIRALKARSVAGRPDIIRKIRFYRLTPRPEVWHQHEKRPLLKPGLEGRRALEKNAGDVRPVRSVDNSWHRHAEFSADPARADRPRGHRSCETSG